MLPGDAVFNNGDSVNLTCLAQGGPGNTFQWTLNKATLLNQSGDNLILPFINATENGGYYTCIVSNAAGSGSATSGVFVSPTIIRQPRDVFVTDIFYYIHIECEVSAFPEPEFQWFNASGGFPYAYAYYRHDTLYIYVYYYYHYYQVCVCGDYYYDYDYYCDIYSSHYYSLPPYGEYYCSATSNNVTVVSERATVYSKLHYLLVL